ncbi:isochorismatase [Lineolata rhizophorae]|uniref:nicotinamidase n=1 Tax=Lineolata rhizophorae TaxID=578093 RepID=A0A6A6P2N4_9PEZI|nr:isochorismatase [Lineolata rhizophorae]
MASADGFKPALVVVDFQEDFCPPNGSLAVTGGRDIAPLVNSLLALPFAMTVATKDWHPQDHVSFASNHAPPNNKPFESVTIANPHNAAETETTRLWPDHCVQGSKGAELVPELDVAKVQHVVEKGQDRRVEMYSAFKAPFDDPVVAQSGLAELLREGGITDVYAVGLAFDYCVKYTAIDSAKEGFKTYVVGEGSRAVDPSAWADVERELKEKGVTVVSADGEEVKKVKDLGAA